MKRLWLIVLRLWHFLCRLWHDRVFKIGLAWWSVLSVSIYLLSGFTAGELSPDISSGDYVPFFERKVPVSQMLVAVIASICLGMFIWSAWKRNNRERKVCDGALSAFFGRQTAHDCASGAVLSLIFAVICIIAIAIFTDEQPSKNVCARWIKIVLVNPGGLFALITGGATLIGTYIAVQSILELKHTISSFPELIERLTNLINQSKDSEEGVAFMAYTPLLGSFNVSKRAMGRLTKAICDPKTKVRMACLEANDHLEWLNLYRKAPTLELGILDESAIQRFHEECETVLNIVSGHANYQEDDTTFRKKIQACRVAPVRLKANQMPGYYFFVSADRGIVVAPISMPRIDNPLPGVPLGKYRTPISVETLGFETTDRKIIQLLQKEFERYASSTGIPDSQPPSQVDVP